MCLHEMKPSFLTLDSPKIYAAETWALKKAQEKGAPNTVCSPNNNYTLWSSTGAAHHTTQVPRVQTVSILMQKATKKLALMLDLFGEVSELSLAIQSESTTLSKAYKLVKRCIRALAQFREGHSGEHTNTAEESCMCRWLSSWRGSYIIHVLQSEDREPRLILPGLDIGYVPAGPDAFFLGGRASSGHNNWFSTDPYWPVF